MVTTRLIYEAFRNRGFDCYGLDANVPFSCVQGAHDMANSNLKWIQDGSEPPANANQVEWEKAQGAVDQYLQAYGLA